MAEDATRLLGNANDEGSRGKKCLKVFTIILAITTAAGIAGVIVLFFFYLGTKDDLATRESDVARVTTLLHDSVCPNIYNEQLPLKDFLTILPTLEGGFVAVLPTEIFIISPVCGINSRVPVPPEYSYGSVVADLRDVGIYVNAFKAEGEHVVYIDSKTSTPTPRAAEKSIVQIVPVAENNYYVLSVSGLTSQFVHYVGDNVTSIVFTNFTGTSVVAKGDTHYISGKIYKENDVCLGVFNSNDNSTAAYMTCLSYSQAVLRTTNNLLYLIYSTPQNITVEKVDPEAHTATVVFNDPNVNYYYDCQMHSPTAPWCIFGKERDTSLYVFDAGFSKQSVLPLGSGQLLYFAVSGLSNPVVLLGDKERSPGTVQTYATFNNTPNFVTQQTHKIDDQLLLGLHPSRKSEFCALITNPSNPIGALRLFPRLFTLADFKTYCH